MENYPNVRQLYFPVHFFRRVCLSKIKYFKYTITCMKYVPACSYFTIHATHSSEKLLKTSLRKVCRVESNSQSLYLTFLFVFHQAASTKSALNG